LKFDELLLNTVSMNNTHKQALNHHKHSLLLLFFFNCTTYTARPWMRG